ncbi:MAG: hypothetical protein OEY29_12080 [Gammaproteobacteria bacterium]|nr:hypothetical protein [Gammaproteobacteria bacterium]
MVDRKELEQLIKSGIIATTPDKDLIDSAIEELENSGFIRTHNDINNMMFKNSLTWEVVYETLLYAERRRFHHLIAMHIERNNKDNLPLVADLLLHHYEKSNAFKQCVLYGAMAGDRAAGMYSNQDAVKFYQRALNSIDHIKASHLIDRCLLREKIGDVFAIAGSDKQAQESFLLSLGLWRQAPVNKKPLLVPWVFKKTTKESALCRKIAISCERQANFDLSLEWLEKAIELMPARPGRVAAQVYASKSVSLSRKGDYRQAIEWGEKALKVARRSGEASDVAYANNMLANSFIETGNIRKAIVFLKNSVATYQENNNLSGIASASSNLGSCFGMLCDMDSAVKYFNIALDNDNRMQNESNIAIDHQNLGNVYLIIGQYDPAIKHFESVLISHECREDLQGAVLIGLCQCYLGKGEIRKAEKNINKAIKLLNETGQSALITEAELELAELRLCQGKPKEAISICKISLVKIQKQNAAYHEVKAERVLGVAYKDINNPDQAVVHLDNSIKISHDIGMIYDEARAILIKSRLQLDKNISSKKDVFKEIKYANEIFNRLNSKSYYDEGRQLLNYYK